LFEKFDNINKDGAFYRYDFQINEDSIIQIISPFYYENKPGIYGFYNNQNDVFWMGNNSRIIIEDKSANIFILNGYHPENMPSYNLIININNEKKISYLMISGKVFNIEIPFENTLDYIYVDLKTEKTFIPKNEGWNDDIRELGAMILSWSSKFSMTNFENNPGVMGFYSNEPDGNWMRKNVKIIEENRNASKFIINGFQPEHMGENKLFVTINNSESDIVELKPDNTFILELEFKNNYDLIYIDILAEKTFIPALEGWNDDIRELGAFITSWSLE